MGMRHEWLLIKHLEAAPQNLKSTGLYLKIFSHSEPSLSQAVLSFFFPSNSSSHLLHSHPIYTNNCGTLWLTARTDCWKAWPVIQFWAIISARPSLQWQAFIPHLGKAIKQFCLQTRPTTHCRNYLNGFQVYPLIKKGWWVEGFFGTWLERRNFTNLHILLFKKSWYIFNITRIGLENTVMSLSAFNRIWKSLLHQRGLKPETNVYLMACKCISASCRLPGAIMSQTILKTLLRLFIAAG